MVDVSIRMGILNMMMDMRINLNVTIVFITHDLALAKYFAWNGRIAVMYLGRVVEIGRDAGDHRRRRSIPIRKCCSPPSPKPTRNRTRNKAHIQLRSEDIPRLTELPPGCSFHPRCPWFAGACAIPTIPKLKHRPRRDERRGGRLHPAHRRRRAATLLMNSEALRAFFRSGVFIAGLALILMLALPRDSAEFVVSTCSLMIGLALMAGVGLVVLLTRR